MKKATNSKANQTEKKSVSCDNIGVEDGLSIGKGGVFGHLVPTEGTPLHKLLHSREWLEKILTSDPVLDTCRGILDLSGNAQKFSLHQEYRGHDKFLLNDIPLCCQLKDPLLPTKKRYKQQGIEISQKSIVLILESPHKYEYTAFMNPLVPANGSTGSQIVGYRKDKRTRHIEWIVEQFTESFAELNSRYPLVLCNPIQYQTSLNYLLGGKLNKAIRNDVWKQIWKIPAVEKDFISRLIKYNPALIINACTSPVSAQIEECVLGRCSLDADIYYCSSYHPSSWNTRQEPKENNNAYGLKNQKESKGNNQWEEK